VFASLDLIPLTLLEFARRITFGPATGDPAACLLELVCCGSFGGSGEMEEVEQTVPKSRRSDAWWYFNDDPNINDEFEENCKCFM
jgi:hypothetical protein